MEDDEANLIPKIPEDLTDAQQWKTYWDEIIKLFANLENLENVSLLKTLCSAVRSSYHRIPTTINNQVASYAAEHCHFPALSGRILKGLSNLSGGSIMSNYYNFLVTFFLLGIHWNYTDCSAIYAKGFNASGENVELLLHWCTHQPYLDSVNTHTNTMLLLKSSVSIIHNVVRNPGQAFHFNCDSLKSALVILTKANDEVLHSCAALTLAYLVSEDEKHLLVEASNCMLTITKIIANCFENENRRSRGFCVEEILSALGALTVNDTINNSLIEHGGVELLKRCCDLDYPQELAYATKCLWNLLFDLKNREDLEKNHDIKNYLLELKQQVATHQGELPTSIMKNIDGALWLIQGEDNESGRLTRMGNKEERKQTHVFISYCWSNKASVLRVRELLRKKSINCWIDVEQMQGSTLDAMADGIDNSDVFLMCMSDPYKLSPNCRMEAQYAFTRHKNIVPLNMQPHYKPTGWLGFILGAKLYYDFSGRRNYEQEFEKLYETILKRNDEEVTEEPIIASHAHETSLTPPPLTNLPPHPPSNGRRGGAHNRSISFIEVDPKLLQWTEHDVTNWLSGPEVKLPNAAKQFTGVDGIQLVQLIKMRLTCPQIFYETVLRGFQLEIRDFLRFCHFAETLMKSNGKQD